MHRRALRTVIATVLSIGLLGVLAATAGAATYNWHVKVTNLTSGQPFSPPLWAVHSSKSHIWQVGHQATNGATLIAEDAFNAPLAALLQSDPTVSSSGIALPPVTNPATPPPIPPGAAREFEFTSKGKYNRLSMMWMLVRSNDAFSGLDSLQVHSLASKHGKKKGSAKNRTLLVNAYDAGTEKNNEQAAYIPGPPFGHMFVRDQDAQLIAPHPGLRPDGELAAYIWTNPVARIEITRVR